MCLVDSFPMLPSDASPIPVAIVMVRDILQLFLEGTGAQPWWIADMGKSMYVRSTVLWNRVDCCSERLDCTTYKEV